MSAEEGKSARRAAYVARAVDAECVGLAATVAGRNDRLNRAAFALGQFLSAGALERHVAESRLLAASEASGYIAKDGLSAARSTIKSGLDRGERRPREIPEFGRLREGGVSAPPSIIGAKTPIISETSRRRDVLPHLTALAIWREAGNPRGTLAERYLASRLCELPYGSALRFHPECPFGSERLPCMVALYRDIVTDKPVAIHRTALTTDGQKIDRKMLGPVGGAAIKIDADAHVTTGLAIGEGIETCLAARQLGFRPVWALGSAGAIAAFPVLPGLEALTILAEHDATNAKAVQACGERWTAAGREVIVVRPRVGKDVNDAIREVAA